MDQQKLVIAVLIIAILFSVISTVISLSILDFKPVFVKQQEVVKTYSHTSLTGNSVAGVNLGIESNLPEGVVVP